MQNIYGGLWENRINIPEIVLFHPPFFIFTSIHFAKIDYQHTCVEWEKFQSTDPQSHRFPNNTIISPPLRFSPPLSGARLFESKADLFGKTLQFIASWWICLVLLVCSLTFIFCMHFGMVSINKSIFEDKILSNKMRSAINGME